MAAPARYRINVLISFKQHAMSSLVRVCFLTAFWKPVTLACAILISIQCNINDVCLHAMCRVRVAGASMIPKLRLYVGSWSVRASTQVRGAARLVADVQQIPEAPGDHQRAALALALQQRVCGHLHRRSDRVTIAPCRCSSLPKGRARRAWMMTLADP